MKRPSVCIVVKGRVQGLGFRPFVFRLAKSFDIKGYVANTLTGVVIVAQGERVKDFIHRLRSSPPPLTKITSFEVASLKTKPFSTFSIRRLAPEKIVDSAKYIVHYMLGTKELSVEVLPDLNICPDCRRELFTPTDRRFLYPFINCTQCGPRYTIIEALPYDRARTTMSRFRMCPECKKEYFDPINRRFHAEPIACPKCGPKLRLTQNIKPQGRFSLSPSQLLQVAQALKNGKLVAIKGLGGFHLACDATNDQAVRLIRKHKERRCKPLALMVEDIKTARALCRVSATAAKVLLSPAAPILLLLKKESPTISLSPLVAPNNPYLGVMVAYTPLHLLLFKNLRSITNKPPVLIMTSANPADEPIATTEKELFSQLGGASHLTLSHNRPIANRCDDSVLFVDGLCYKAGGASHNQPVMVRRARGYTPQPLCVGGMFHVKHTTLGMGADQRNAFCLASGERFFLSPHIGDMASAKAESFFLDTLRRLTDWTKLSPERVVCDLHPDYHSTRLAERLSQQLGAKLSRVQHHCAHILSVMVEHNLPGPVLGLACDGTGYGADGTIWGCEFLLINKGLSWARVGHLGYLRHNAGAGVLADPVQLAIAYCLQSGVKKAALYSLGLIPRVITSNAESWVVTSSLGRLFDAVSAITGICRRATFEGEAAIALEAAALKEQAKGKVNVKMKESSTTLTSTSALVIDPKPIIFQAVEAIQAKERPERVALWFHRTLVRLFVTATLHLAKKFRVQVICLSGGSFQNSLLRRGVKTGLTRAGMQVYHNQLVPLNDGGLALGQVGATIF